MAYMHKETNLVYSFIPKEGYNMEDFIEIDELIAPTISLLNKKGYITAYSCGGHILEGLPQIGTVIDNDGNEREIIVSCAVNQCYIVFDDVYDLSQLPEGFTSEITVNEENNNKNQIDICKMNEETDDVLASMEAVLRTNKDLYKWASALPDIGSQ